RRPFWSPRHSLGAFFGTTLLLGTTFSAMIFAALGDFPPARNLTLIALLARTTLFVWRQLEIHSGGRNPESGIYLNVRAIRELLPWTPPARLMLFIASTLFGLLAAFDFANAAGIWATATAVTTLASEILVRWIFFVAGGAKRMPGGIAA
ncbi:MAG TPA: hypothetical protein VFV81_04945, partial [Verrucomicrobiae bacterium]|nr:hypothetical protein [Verrucomicrobiae bacterium]